MSDTLCLRPDRAHPERFEWARAATDDGVDSGSGGIDAAAAACAGQRVILLAPADSVLLTRAKVPARQRQRILQALPYVLEDRLVQDVELLHFAIGARDADGAINVAIIERELLRRWLTELRAVGIEPAAVIPEALALPFEDGRWTLLQDGTQTLVRTAAQGGFTIDNDNLVTLLAQTLVEADEAPPQALVCHFPADAPGLALLPGLAIEAEIETLAEAPLALMARHVDEQQAIDLLQGAFSRREEFGRLYRPWIAAGVVLALLVTVYGGLLLQEQRELTREADDLQQAIETSYMEAFPDARRVVNPRVQMERGLESLRRGGSADAGGFLDMMHAAAPVLKAVDGLELNRINYREERLDLALSLQNLQQVDQLRQRMSEDSGLAITIQSASAQAERVDARVQLTVPTP